MKLRNGMLALATATTLVAGGVTATPAFAEGRTDQQTSSLAAPQLEGPSEADGGEGAENPGSSQDSLNQAATAIGFVSALVGLLSTIYTFAQKLGFTVPKFF